MSTRAIALVAAVGFVAPAFGEVFYFTDEGAFVQFNATHGKVLKGIETFEESTIDEGGKIAFPNSLCPGIPAPTFPNGLAEPNVCIQTNITPGPCPP